MASWWEDYKKRKGLSSGGSESSTGKTYTERITTDEHRQAAKSSTWWEDYKKKNDLERRAAADRQRAAQSASRLKYRSERNQRFASANRQLKENRNRDAAEDEIRELFRNPFSTDAEWQAGVLQRNAERYKRDLPLYQQALQNASTWGEYFSTHRQAGESQSAVKHQFERYQQAAQQAEQDRNESNLINRPAQWQAENLTPQEIEQRLAYYRSEAATPTVTDKDREARAYLYPEAALQKDPHGARFDERLVEDAGQDAVDAAYKPILTEQEKAAVEEADQQIIKEKAERNYENVQRLLAAQAGQTEATSRARGNELIEEIAQGGEAADRAKTGKAMFEQQQKKIDEESPTIIYGAHGNYSSAMAERTKRGYILGSDWDNVPEDRKQAVYALYTESPEKAIELAKFYIADAQNAKDEERQAWYAQSGWTAALGLVSSAAAHLGSAVDPFGPVGQELTRYGDNALAGGSQWADAATGYQKIPEWVPVVGGKGAGDLYQTVGSVVQSAAVAAPAILAGRYDQAGAEVLSKLGLALMGSSAAASDYRESVAAGMDEDRAKLHALAAGVEEALFEEVSLDKLIKMDTSGGLKAALKNWLVQSGIEGSEELATSIANRFTDEMISGAGQSKVERRASELIANGMNSTEAHTQAESEWMTDTLYEGFSGFLSGGMMTGGNYALRGIANLKGRAVNAAKTRKAQKQAGAAVSRSEGSVEALQAYAKDKGIEIKAVETTEQNAGESTEQGNQDGKQNSYSSRDYRSISDTTSKVTQSIRNDLRGKTVQEQQAVRDSLVEKYGEGIAPVVNNAISIETAARVRLEYGDVDSIQAARNQAVSEIKDESLRRAVSDGYDSAAYSLAASQGGEDGMNTMSRYIQQRKNTGSGAEMTMNATVTAQDGSTKSIAITGMSEDGKRVSLADGSEVAVKDLQADADTTSAIQQLADLDLGDDATKVLQAYQQSGVSGTDGYRWLMDYATAYNQGRTRQISLEQAAQRSSLDERTVMDAYTLGQQAANRETQAGLEKLKNLPKRKGANGRTANIDTTEIKGKTMSKSELEQFELANQYAQALGVDMTWFSSKEQDGKFIDKNGAYENGKIYMDIHAGRNFAADLTSGILATMGHELTHFQQQYAPEEYQAIKEFLFEQIVKSSPNGEARLERLIWEKQRRSGYTLSRKAAEDEVVADACQKMLRDSKAVHDFASQQPEAANGVIRWLDKWFKKVRSIFGRGGNYSEEAQLMDSLEQDVKAAFGELWDKALKQATKVHDEVGNIEKPATEKAQNSDREDQSLRGLVSELEDQLDMAELNGLSQAEIRKLNNELIKARGQLDNYTTNQRRQAKKTSFNEILRNLENYERIDLESLAEQISDSAWDDYDELSNEELIDALRETINERLDDFAPGDADNPKYGLFVKKPKTAGNISVVRNSDRDTEYLELAKDPEKNKARLQEMVGEAARKAGYTSPMLFHGTNAFGFTTIKTSKDVHADGFSFWAANKESAAGTYTRYGKTREIESEIGYEETEEAIEERSADVDEAIDDFRYLIDRTFSEWFYGQQGNEVIRRGVDDSNPDPGSGDGVYDFLVDQVADAFNEYSDSLSETYEDFADFQDRSKEWEKIEDAIEAIEGAYSALSEIQSEGLVGGIYELYANTDNMYVVDAKGAAWNALHPEGLPKIERGEYKNIPYKTRDVANWARDNGYDGVIFKNIKDNGAYGRTESFDVYAFFNPQQQVKSADPVTYDDDGNVIPLSERFNTENQDIRYSQREQYEEAVEASDVLTRYSLREAPAPQKTIKAYKAFYVKDGKLYPPMVSNNTNEEDKQTVKKASSGTMKGLETPVGVWLDADVGGIAVDENGVPLRTKTTGRLQVQNDKGGGTLAFRPGWHLGEWPDASQFNVKDPVTGALKSVMPDNLVFAECEIAADVDYQLEAYEYGISDKGGFSRTQAGLPRVPTNGYYKYRTNVDPTTAPWYITGAMKVTRILSDEERRQICNQFGVTPQERASHKDIDLEAYGLKAGPVKQTENLERFRKNKASYDNDALLKAALEDENYSNAYVRRTLDFDNETLVKEFELDRISPDQVKKYRESYQSPEVMRSERESAAKANVSLDSQSESAAPSDGTLFSERTWSESRFVRDRENAAKALAKALNVSVRKAEQYIDDINSVAKVIADDRARLDYLSSPGRSAFKSNAEYGGSIDFSTLCKKRQLLTGTFNAIQHALANTVLTAEDVLRVRQMMQDAGLEVNCGMCYVEGSRARMGEYNKTFLELYKKYFPDNWQPKMEDVNTTDGLELMRMEHPECYEQYEHFYNNHGTLRSEDKAIFSSQAKPKEYQLRTEYKGEIKEKFQKDSTVEAKNLNGGLRMQSFSDFEIVHLIDCMQVIMDMSEVGLAGQAYTKVPEFAEALGRTGLKINLSLVAKGVDENGKLIFNDVEGMPHERAFGIREKYSENVGTILVVYDDAQLVAAMADDKVDFIIPFHRSQWRKSQYAAMGLPKTTKDYTYQQNEKWLNPKAHTHEYRGKTVPTKCTNYMPNDYWDFSLSGKQNAEKYLEMCANDGKRPKFYKLLQNNGDGTYSLKADGSTDGYWKLLIDFKMYDNNGVGVPQQPVQPIFDMDNAMQMLDDYSGDPSRFPVAEGIVDEFVSQYKAEHPDRQYSERDYSTPSDEELLMNASVEDAESPEARVALQNSQKQARQIRDLTRRLERLQTEIRGYEGDSPNRISVRQFTRQALDLFGIPSGVRTDMGELLQSVAEGVLAGHNLSQNDIMYFFETLITNGREKSVADETLAEIRDDLKGRKIYVNENVKAEFGDDWNAFRKRAFSLGIQLTNNEKNMGIDSVNLELAELYPGKFDAGDTDLRSILENIVDTAESGKTSNVPILDAMREIQKQTGEPVREQLQTMLDQFTRQIEIMQGQAAVERKARAGNAAEIAKARKQINEAKEALREVRKQRDAWKRKSEGADARQKRALDAALRNIVQHDAKQIAEAVRQKQALAKKLQDQIDHEKKILSGELRSPELAKLLKAEREKTEARVKEQKEQVFQNYKERKKAGDLRGRIKNLSDEMKRRMTNPTDRAYVPASLYQSMTKLADVLDNVLSPNPGTKAEARYRAMMDAIRGMAREYEDVKNLDPVFASEYEQEISDAIGEIERILERKNASWIDGLTGDTQKGLAELNSDELQQLYDLMRQINYTITNATKVFGNSNYKSIFDAQRAVADQQNSMKGLNMVSRLERKKRLRLLNGLSVMRATEMMAGWDRSAALYQFMHGIEQGADDAWAWVMDYNKSMQDLKTGKNEKEYRQALTKQLDFDITDRDGLKVTMTKMQALQILMTAEREEHNDKLLHLQEGGAVIRNAIDLQNGKGAKARSQTISVTPELIQKISDSLTEWDRAYMKTVRDYFKREGKRTNEILYKLKHKVLKTEEFYVPYTVDRNYLEANLNEQQALNMWVKTPGSTNALKQKAKQPVIIDGMDTVMGQHVKEIGNYIGMAIPIRDFSKVYNGMIPTEGPNPLPVKETIERTFGKAGQHLLTQAVIDVQGGTARQNWESNISQFLNKLQGAFVKSALLINPSVTIKQAASYIAAESVISHLALERGNHPVWARTDESKSFMPGGLIAQLFARPEGKTAQRIYNEIDQYTSLHYQRRQGMSMAEIAEQANRTGPIKRRINAIGASMEQSKIGHAFRRTGENLNPITWIQRMDVATTAALWVACKEQAKLDKLAVGSEEFWKRTTELYERCIRETQPMYDGLHRTANQKQAGGLMQYLFPFRTVPIQNHGQLAASYEAYKAARESKNEAKIKEAGKFFRKTAWAQTESAFVFSVMTFLAAILKRKTKKYRDEEGEFDAGSLTKGLLTDVGSTLISVLNPMYGSELFNFGSRAVDKFEGNSGYTYDAFSVGVVDMINDLASSGDRLLADAGKIVRGENVNAADFWNHAMNLLLKGGKLAGIPADTVKTYFEGTKGNIQDAIEGRIPALNDESWERDAATNARRYLKAYMDNDTKKASAVLAELRSTLSRSGKDEEKINEAIRKAVSVQAVEKVSDGTWTEEEAEAYLLSTGAYDDRENPQKDAWNAIRKGVAKATSTDEEFNWKQYDDLAEAVANGEDVTDLLTEYRNHGYSDDQINAAIRSGIQEAMTAGDLDGNEAADALIRYGVTYSKDGKDVVYDEQTAWKKVQEWADKAEHTDEEGELEDGYKYSAYTDLFDAVDANQNADGVIQTMVQNGGYDTDSLRGKIKEHLLERFIAGQITETALKNQLSRYCKISKADDANEIVANAKCKRDFGVYPDDLKEAFKDGDLSQNQAEKALQQYKGLSKADAQNRVHYWGYDGDLSENAWAKWAHELKSTGLSVDNWEKVYKVKSSAKGTDANGDGRADSGTVKAEVVSYIDSMNIPKSQKKAIYLAFGWAASTMPNWR